ncbi:hydrolase [Robertkochia marina]|uniref:Hydrolase n=1 Tax=Robertkochia marina TaxID=1227945 RepID=A0A4S3M0A2_9FLAO|nr:hydrolase [Robertkochia marina]THD67832.1 hydrolase [Robertkochia marina]TRZ42129.1 hydrolase [Robertkochia marina]
MKTKIFIYLFLFSALINLYQFVSAKNYVDRETAKNDSLSIQNDKLQDSVQSLLLDRMDLQYFDLDNNDDAFAYYEHLNMENPSRYISDKLLETNEQSGNNPLVPYDGMSGAPMKINKIKVLNHKWIIADFSDGKYWGEILIEYYLNDDQSIDFTTLDHLLYTRS